MLTRLSSISCVVLLLVFGAALGQNTQPADRLKEEVNSATCFASTGLESVAIPTLERLHGDLDLGFKAGVWQPTGELLSSLPVSNARASEPSHICALHHVMHAAASI